LDSINRTPLVTRSSFVLKIKKRKKKKKKEKGEGRAQGEK